MYRFTSWTCFSILVLFCIDYNLADPRDQEISRLITLANTWTSREDRVIPRVELQENDSRAAPFSIVSIEKKRGLYNESHFLFDFIGSNQRRSFYDFQIDAFTYYFDRNLKFILRESGMKKTLSLNFPTDAGASYFYSKVLKFGTTRRGRLIVKAVQTMTYERSTKTRKSLWSKVDINFIYVDGKAVFRFTAYANDEATTADVPVVIFTSEKFNIGRATIGNKVMFYLTDKPDTIIAASLSSPRAAKQLYDILKRERVDDVSAMISEEEMQSYTDNHQQDGQDG